MVMLGSPPNADSPWAVLQDLNSQLVAATRDPSFLSCGKEVLLRGSVETFFLVVCYNLVVRNRHLFSMCIDCQKLHMLLFFGLSIKQCDSIIIEKYHPSLPSMINLKCIVAPSDSALMILSLCDALFAGMERARSLAHVH